MAKINYDHILIRYGELSTKGKNRKDFISRLLSNIKTLLVAYPNLEYDKTHDRMYIRLNDEDHVQVLEHLKCVFGISSFSLCIKVETDLDIIKDITLQMALDSDKATFKVFTKRTYKQYPMSSDEINRDIATNILKNTELKVNVKIPELKVQIELREDATYIIYNTIKGAGGYPVGSCGKGLLMMSGGIDSPVAGYLTMKRGIRVECVHFASPPYTSPNARNKVLDLVRNIAKYQGVIKLYIVPFTDIQMKIYERSDESYAITLMRRMMYRIADSIAKNNKCLMVTNGESVGQVASQTLHSMAVIEKACDTLVCRPLFAYDKLEIIDVARRIGTYEISILPFDDCCTIFTPKNPTTRPRMDKVEHYEAKVDYQQMIEDALATTEVIYINHQDDEELF